MAVKYILTIIVISISLSCFSQDSSLVKPAVDSAAIAKQQRTIIDSLSKLYNGPYRPYGMLIDSTMSSIKSHMTVTEYEKVEQAFNIFINQLWLTWLGMKVKPK